MWQWIRRVDLEYKVYFVLFVIFVGAIFWAVYGSSWVQERTYDDDVFQKAACESDQRLFDVDKVPRKDVSLVQDVTRMIPIQFPDGNYGLMDTDGSIVVEGVYSERITYYGGLIRMVDEEGVKFFNSSGDLLDTRSVAKDYYEALRMSNLRRNILMDPAYALINRRSLSSQFASSVEEDSGLEVFYVSIFREPQPYYVVRFVHTKEAVFGVYDQNLERITDRFYQKAIFFDDTLVAKVESVCATMYISFTGETLWIQARP